MCFEQISEANSTHTLRRHEISPTGQLAVRMKNCTTLKLIEENNAKMMKSEYIINFRLENKVLSATDCPRRLNSKERH